MGRASKKENPCCRNVNILVGQVKTIAGFLKKLLLLIQNIAAPLELGESLSDENCFKFQQQADRVYDGAIFRIEKRRSALSFGFALGFVRLNQPPWMTYGLLKHDRPGFGPRIWSIPDASVRAEQPGTQDRPRP